MPSLQRPSLVNGRQIFRSRLKRALSLSSSESCEESGMRRSRVDSPSADDGSYETAADGTNEKDAENQDDYHWRPWEIQPEDIIDRPRASGELSSPGDYGFLALECVSESLEKSLSHQNAQNEKICVDLADIMSRLAAMETHVKDLRKEAKALRKNRSKEKSQKSD